MNITRTPDENMRDLSNDPSAMYDAESKLDPWGTVIPKYPNPKQLPGAAQNVQQAMAHLQKTMATAPDASHVISPTSLDRNYTGLAKKVQDYAAFQKQLTNSTASLTKNKVDMAYAKFEDQMARKNMLYQWAAQSYVQSNQRAKQLSQMRVDPSRFFKTGGWKAIVGLVGAVAAGIGMDRVGADPNQALTGILNAVNTEVEAQKAEIGAAMWRHGQINKNSAEYFDRMMRIGQFEDNAFTGLVGHVDNFIKEQQDLVANNGSYQALKSLRQSWNQLTIQHLVNKRETQLAAKEAKSRSGLQQRALEVTKSHVEAAVEDGTIGADMTTPAGFVQKPGDLQHSAIYAAKQKQCEAPGQVWNPYGGPTGEGEYVPASLRQQQSISLSCRVDAKVDEYHKNISEGKSPEEEASKLAEWTFNNGNRNHITMDFTDAPKFLNSTHWKDGWGNIVSIRKGASAEERKAIAEAQYNMTASSTIFAQTSAVVGALRDTDGSWEQEHDALRQIFVGDGKTEPLVKFDVGLGRITSEKNESEAQIYEGYLDKYARERRGGGWLSGIVERALAAGGLTGPRGEILHLKRYLTMLVYQAAALSRPYITSEKTGRVTESEFMRTLEALGGAGVLDSNFLVTLKNNPLGTLTSFMNNIGGAMIGMVNMYNAATNIFATPEMSAASKFHFGDMQERAIPYIVSKISRGTGYNNLIGPYSGLNERLAAQYKQNPLMDRIKKQRDVEEKARKEAEAAKNKDSK